MFDRLHPPREAPPSRGFLHVDEWGVTVDGEQGHGSSSIHKSVAFEQSCCLLLLWLHHGCPSKAEKLPVGSQDDCSLCLPRRWLLLIFLSLPPSSFTVSLADIRATFTSFFPPTAVDLPLVVPFSFAAAFVVVPASFCLLSHRFVFPPGRCFVHRSASCCCSFGFILFFFLGSCCGLFCRGDRSVVMPIALTFAAQLSKFRPSKLPPLANPNAHHWHDCPCNKMGEVFHRLDQKFPMADDCFLSRPWRNATEFLLPHRANSLEPASNEDSTPPVDRCILMG